MLNPIELLMEEHELIVKSLDGLEGFSRLVQSKGLADGRSELKLFVEFIQEFADRTHHAKEEKILFEEMVSNGFSKEAGPIAMMLFEHDEGRKHVQKLKGLAEQEGEWNDAAQSEVTSTALAFTSLLKQHIMKENQILYPMAQQQLPKDSMNRVAEECSLFDEKEKASGENARLRQLGEDLHARYCK